MSQPPEDLDAQVARADHDRWLAARFVADEAGRADLVALYAFNHELSKIAGAVRQAMLGEIRLAWWREALDEIFEGRPVRAHPAAQALAVAASRRTLPRDALEAMIDARARELDPTPLADGPELLGYVDRTAGALMVAAARALDPNAEPHAVRAAARAWGLAGLLRNRKAGGKGLLGPEPDQAVLEDRIGDLMREARREVRSLPVKAFPAVAYVALTRPYVRGREPGDLEKRLRLIGAVATGRL
jgi:phytoene synthase